MKKGLLFILLVLLMSSCRCSKTPELVVENTITNDKEYMYLNYDSTFKWYESNILMENFMDEDPSGKVVGVSNVFQIEKDSNVKVVTLVHSIKADSVIVESGFWVEDMDMSKDTIKVTYKEAFEKAMKSNCIKPHSQYCVLRKAVGPKAANPQYIFGNSKAQIYVDAITGDVTDKDPVY